MRKMRLIFNGFACIIIAVLTTVCSEAQPFRKPKSIDFDTEKDIEPVEFGNHYQIPAFAYSVIKDGSVITEGAAGRIHVYSDKPVNKNHWFRLGSCTKGFTGLMAAKCVDSGLINWDTKFFDLYPELQIASDTSYLNITLADLLSHRANIQPYTHKVTDSGLDLDSETDRERRFEFCKKVLLQSPYGNSVYNYSNAGYSLASVMLEKATGHTWEELADETAKQLGIEILNGRPNEKEMDQPWGHTKNLFGKMKPVGPGEYFNNSSVIAPAGALSMKIGDMSEYIMEILNSLNGPGGLLKQQTAEFMLFGIEDYSIGWGNNYDGDTYAFHDGSDGSYYSHVMIFKELNSAVIIMTTAPNCETTRLFITDFRNYLKNKYIYQIN